MVKKHDYHTHNGYSGCASKEPYTVLDGWSEMQTKGITKYGISNHYPTRKIFGDYLPNLRKEIDTLQNENILLGVELELDDEMGKNHLESNDFELIDYIVGSAHHQPNSFLTLPDIEEDEIEEFFESFRNVLVNNFKKIPINIWGHPFLQEFETFGDKYWQKYIRPIYLECLDICAEKRIAIELTPAYQRKCGKQPSTFRTLDEMYELAMKNKDVIFTTSSDAHNLSNLGDISIPIQYVRKFNIPEDRILELNKR